MAGQRPEVLSVPGKGLLLFKNMGHFRDRVPLRPHKCLPPHFSSRTEAASTHGEGSFSPGSLSQLPGSHLWNPQDRQAPQKGREGLKGALLWDLSEGSTWDVSGWHRNDGATHVSSGTRSPPRTRTLWVPWAREPRG